jgi:hypothetical protein
MNTIATKMETFGPQPEGFHFTFMGKRLYCKIPAWAFDTAAAQIRADHPPVRGDRRRFLEWAKGQERKEQSKPSDWF